MGGMQIKATAGHSRIPPKYGWSSHAYWLSLSTKPCRLYVSQTCSPISRSTRDPSHNHCPRRGCHEKNVYV